MFRARKEQLKDFRKLIRIAKKLVPLVQEKNSLEKDFMSGLEDYFRMKDDIKLLEKSRLISTKKHLKFLKEQLKEIEQKNPITPEKKKLKRKIDTSSNEIEEYVKYIESKSQDFTYFNLTSKEYKLYECDELSIFIILLIFKKRIAEIEDRNIAEHVLLDSDCQFYFRKRLFFYENTIRNVLTKKINKDCDTEYQPTIWEKQDDLLDYPLFQVIDFESFMKLL